ncbi:MAG: helix-turn-helix domain-containing protein [Spirochaetota bacterium]
MGQFILWFNIIAFALLIASAGFSYIVYARNRALWLRDYLIYTVAYALWLLFATWAYFQQAYLAEARPGLTMVFVWVRAAASLPIAYWGPLFLLQAAGVARSRRVRGAMVGVTAVLALVILAFLVFGMPLLGRSVTAVFNLGFSVLATYAALRMNRRSPNPAGPMLPVVVYFAISYVVLVVLSTLLPFVLPGEIGIQVNALASGAFLFLWAIVAMLVSLRWIGGHEEAREPIPPAFISDYGISPRESDILRVLVTGKTSGEIGEDLCISQRTVEAHLYRIYRKCNVTNRVELVNRIGEYRG